MTVKDTFLKLLPDSLNRMGTNMQKIARFVGEPLDDVQDLYRKIDAWRAIDSAEGEALDKLGRKYGQARGAASDAFYRVMIKSKLITRTGDATTNGILRSIKVSLGEEPTGIKVLPIREDTHDDSEPLAIRITNIPLGIARTAWEQNYLAKRIRDTVAAGVRVDAVRFFVESPSHMYIGMVARFNRTMVSSSSLLLERNFTGGSTQHMGGTAQRSVTFNSDATSDVRSIVGFSRVGTAIAKE